MAKKKPFDAATASIVDVTDPLVQAAAIQAGAVIAAANPGTSDPADQATLAALLAETILLDLADPSSRGLRGGGRQARVDGRSPRG
jgi:hypothetical protein